MRKYRSFILFLFLGISLIFLYKVINSSSGFLIGMNRYEAEQKINKETAEIEQLKSAIKRKEERIKVLEYLDDNDIINLLSTKKNELENLIGYTDVEGPGVILILEDSNYSEEAYENPNDLIIHDRDIDIVVDELRQAGAEAISVNDNRVIFNVTTFKCIGPVVKINEEKITSPFIIKAIGNRKFLEASINGPDSYCELLSGYGINVDVNTSINVKIKKYDSIIKSKYINNKEV